MSDVEDILSEFSSPSSTPQGPQGINRYIPDPAEYSRAQHEAQSSSFKGMYDAGKDMWNNGAGPVNIAQAALNGLSYIVSPLTGLGAYLGGPVERGISDLGAPGLGKVAGNTVALAPGLMTPFPGARAMGTLAEGAGAMMGEAPAARSISQNLPAMFAGKAAPVASEIDDVLHEFDNGPRQTSRAKTIEDELALKWYQDQFKGGAPEPTVPSFAGPPEPQDVRLLHKGNPKVGELKYAKDEAGGPVSISGYQNQGERPTFRTSHAPGYTPPDEAPIDFYNNAFRREFEPGNVAIGSQPSQIPLHPDVAKILPEDLGVDAQRLQQSYMPNVERGQVIPPQAAEDAARVKGMASFGPGSPEQIDPKLLSELQLKFGMGSPRQAPIPGSTPMPSNVLNFPKLPIPDNPGTVAKPSLSNFGDVEIGQPYDIVHTAGAMEMRAPGGIVKEMVQVNEPIVRNGKTEYQPAIYGVLEDGRRVPAKMLKPANGKAANMSNIGQSEPRPSVPAAKAPEAATEATADPAFDKLREAMQKKTSEPAETEVLAPKYQKTTPEGKLVNYDPKDRADVQTVIKKMLSAKKGKVLFSQLSETMPGLTRSMFNKAVDEMVATTAPNLVRSKVKGSDDMSLVRRAMTKDESKQISRAAGDAVKDNNFTNGLAKIRENIKGNTTYLHNFSGAKMQAAGHEIKDIEVARRLNKMLEEGKIKVTKENSGDPVDRVTTTMFDPGVLDEDVLITFLKPTKSNKTGKVLATEAKPKKEE
jgi:hypothetical protein